LRHMSWIGSDSCSFFQFPNEFSHLFDPARTTLGYPDFYSRQLFWQYRLYVRQKVQRGIQDVKEGRIYSQEEVEKRMGKWVAE